MWLSEVCAMKLYSTPNPPSKAQPWLHMLSIQGSQLATVLEPAVRSAREDLPT